MTPTQALDRLCTWRYMDGSNVYGDIAEAVSLVATARAALAHPDRREEVSVLRDALMKACGDDVEMCRRYVESQGGTW